MFLEKASNANVHMGLHRVDGTSEWQWMNSEPYNKDLVPWDVDEPNGAAGVEDCAMLRSATGKMMDRDCDGGATRLICQRKDGK